jgi:maltose O-acetyltransferase
VNKILRLIRHDWPLHFVLVLTNWLPDNVFCAKLRGSLARLFLGSCGPGLILARNITFYNPMKIHLGTNVFVGYGCWFSAAEDIIVEDEVMFGPYCIITSGNHSRSQGSFRFGALREAPIRIKRGSWISGHVTVTAGSVVGEGSLIAAGAVVRKEVPANVLAGGIPANVIKNLSDT